MSDKRLPVDGFGTKVETDTYIYNFCVKAKYEISFTQLVAFLIYRVLSLSPTHTGTIPKVIFSQLRIFKTSGVIKIARGRIF